jgi:primosomal protein N''
MTTKIEERPRASAEVRAWVLAAAALMVQLIGVVWWAATLSAQMQALREVVAELKAQIATTYSAENAQRDLAPLRAQVGDHEARLRLIEQVRR